MPTVGGWQTGEVLAGLRSTAARSGCDGRNVFPSLGRHRQLCVESPGSAIRPLADGAQRQRRRLYDASTGATCDGLKKDSVNENQGAESTLAGLAILQIAEGCFTKSPATATR